MKLPVDNPLFPFIQMLHSYANAVGRANDAYLSKEAEKKHFEAVLISKAGGSSQKEKETNAYASKEFLEFHKSLARLKAELDFHRLKFSVIEKEYFATHQQLSLDGGLINKKQE
jgi:hypothetical protein